MTRIEQGGREGRRKGGRGKRREEGEGKGKRQFQTEIKFTILVFTDLSTAGGEAGGGGGGGGRIKKTQFFVLRCEPSLLCNRSLPLFPL